MKKDDVTSGTKDEVAAKRAERAAKAAAAKADREAAEAMFPAPWLDGQPGVGWQQEQQLAIEWVNAQYALVDSGGELAIWTREPKGPPGDQRFSLYKDQAFKTILAPYSVPAPGPNGKIARRRLAEVWLASELRSIGVVGAWPQGSEPPNGINLWRGFAVEPSDTPWDTIDEYLLNVICGGDAAAHAYLTRLLAYKVQNPTRSPEVAIVLQSDESGTGKSTFGRMLMRLFGDAGKVIHSAEDVFGKFGDVLIGAQVLVLEEALFVGNKAYTDRFKALVTEPRVTVRPIWRAPVMVPNMAMMVVATNHGRAIEAMLDDRRHLMLGVSDCRRGDHAYWSALHAAINGPELQGFLQSLLEAELGEWHPRREIPQTEALIQQKELSLPAIGRWVDAAVEEGATYLLGGTAPGWDEPFEVTSAVAYGKFLEWCKANGEKYPPSLAAFRSRTGARRWLNAQLVDRRGRGESANRGGRTWLIPACDQLAAHLDGLVGRRW